MRQTEKYVENQASKFTYRKKGCQEYNAKVCIFHNFFLDLHHEIERKMDQLNTLKKTVLSSVLHYQPISITVELCTAAHCNLWVCM